MWPNACMPDPDFKSVSLVLLDNNQQVRKVLVSHLFHLGFRDIIDTDRLNQVEEHLTANSVDLLVATTGDGDDLAAAED